jgi:hypothetical protein
MTHKSVPVIINDFEAVRKFNTALAGRPELLRMTAILEVPRCRPGVTAYNWAIHVYREAAESDAAFEARVTAVEQIVCATSGLRLGQVTGVSIETPTETVT